SILQASPEEPGAVRFVPDLPPQKQAALSKLAMGKAIRVTLRFQQRFWDDLRTPPSTESKSLANMSFLLPYEDSIPTLCTTRQVILPIIIGRSPYNCAESRQVNTTKFQLHISVV